MLRHGILDPSGKVVNIIIWDGITPWSPPEGHTVVQHDEIGVHDMYDHENKVLIKYNPEPIDIVAEKPQLSLEALKEQLDELRSQLASREN